MKLLSTALALALVATAQDNASLEVEVLRGAGAVAIPGGSVADIEVQVKNNGQPQPGAAVTFLLPPSGPGGAFVDGGFVLVLTTGEDGRAIARGIRASSSEGEYTVRINASYQGSVASTTLTQRISSAPPEADPAPSTGPAAVRPSPTPKPAAKKKSSTGLLIGLLVAGAGGGAAAAFLGGGSKNSGGGPVVSQPPPASPSVRITASGPNIGAP
jgi:hypothetical protein